MKLKVGGIYPLSTIDADGLSFVVYFQGCSRGCPGCHNPELQSSTGGEDVSVYELLEQIKENIEWYRAVVLQGGEPLEQHPVYLAVLIKEIQKLGLKVWLYTGYEYEEIPEWYRSHVDVIKSGAYVEELRTGSFPASSNQKIYRR